MFKKTVVAYFQRQAQVARTLGLARSTVHGWGNIIPEKQALKLERLTEGALKYDPSLYEKTTK